MREYEDIHMFLDLGKSSGSKLSKTNGFVTISRVFDEDILYWLKYKLTGGPGVIKFGPITGSLRSRTITIIDS
jgi:hypothetical protein